MTGVAPTTSASISSTFRSNGVCHYD
jgi:hypothetical protein